MNLMTNHRKGSPLFPTKMGKKLIMAAFHFSASWFMDLCFMLLVKLRVDEITASRIIFTEIHYLFKRTIPVVSYKI